MSDKLSKFKEIAKIVSESVTKQEFQDNFRVIIKATQEFFKRADLKLGEIETRFTFVVNGIKENYNRDMEALKTKVMAMCKDYVGTMIENHDKRMTDLEDTLEGKEADITPRIASVALDLARSELLPQIPTKEAINENLSKSGGLIADALETLPEGNKLKVSAIEGLEKILEELRQLRTRSLGGGGFNRSAMEQYFVDDDTPVEVPNGVITDFTPTYTPKASSLKVYNDGQRMRLGATKDYTYNSTTKKVVYNTAPLADVIITFDYRRD